MSFTFGKSYKLCSKILIEQVYQKGREVKSFPFYLKYIKNENTPKPFQIVFVVPKKKYKQATTRNQIRRYIREAVRIEKGTLEDKLIEKNISLALFLIYAGDENLTTSGTQRDIAKLFKKLIYDLDQKHIQ
jgi:ribonuclease P protein component